MELKIVYMPVTALKPYEKNTRKHEKKDVDNIARSIERFGMNDPVGIWSDKNIVVEGHGRLLACKQLGMTEVPCVRLDHLTDEQRREYAIAHNATAELSIWDKDFLAEELESLDLSEFDFEIELPSFDEEYEKQDYEQHETIQQNTQYENEDYRPSEVDTELLERFKEHESDFLVKRRVIITYDPEKELELCRLIGVKQESLKVLYDIDELLGGGE